MSMFDVSPAAVNLSSLTESAITGEMAATTAAGSAALTGVVPMAASADDVAFASAMAGAGGAYLGRCGGALRAAGRRIPPARACRRSATCFKS